MAAQHTIGIIIFDDVLTSEVVAPAEVFGIATKEDWFNDWKITLIGVDRKETITTAEGITIAVDMTISEASPVDVLIVPGATELDALIKNKELEDFIKNHKDTAKWVSSNCSGAFLLGNSGILDGIKATTWSGGESLLQKQFPRIDVIYDKPVVVDNRRLTSNGGIISYQAALVLLAKLTSKDHAHDVFDALQMNKLVDWSLIEPLMD